MYRNLSMYIDIIIESKFIILKHVYFIINEKLLDNES